MTTIDYDPLSHEAMSNPHPLYDKLRAAGHAQYLPHYDAWALASFESIWQTSTTYSANLTWAAGSTPTQVFLGEPVPRTFMSMDEPDHRAYRKLVIDDYTKESVAQQAPDIARLTRRYLDPLVARGRFDIHRDFAARVSTVWAGHLIGLDEAASLELRDDIDAMFHRVPHQREMNEANIAAAMHFDETVRTLVADAARTPDAARGHLHAWLNETVDGAAMPLDEVVNNVFAMLVVGSEVTPLGVANTVRLLAAHPEQLARVVADRALVPWAFGEGLRIDQPTNLLCRKVRRDFSWEGYDFREGQGVIALFASANRDEREFTDAARFDIDRRPRRNLSFGHGLHKCLGEHLGMTLGTILLEELLVSVGTSFDVDEAGALRRYGEILCGFDHLPITLRG